MTGTTDSDILQITLSEALFRFVGGSDDERADALARITARRGDLGEAAIGLSDLVENYAYEACMSCVACGNCWRDVELDDALICADGCELAKADVHQRH